MGQLKIGLRTTHPSTPPAGYVYKYWIGSTEYYKTEDGIEHALGETMTLEQVQDLLATSFQDTSSINFTYNDALNVFTADVIQTALDHTNFQNKGTNTHAQIDAHIANTSNPHSVTKSQVGLANVDNTSDLNKPISNATQTALDAKVDDTEKGTANGVATLDATVKVPVAQIPALPYASTSHTHTASEITDFSTAVQVVGDANYADIAHTHPDATTSASGFMSATDKTKLDGLVNDVVLKSVTQLNNSSNVTFTAITEHTINVVAGRTYVFEMLLRFQTAANATGLGMSIGGTATGSLTANANAILGTGTAGLYSGPLTALNGVVTTTSVAAANTPYLARITGIFIAATSGTIYPQFRSEVNGSQASILANSITTYKEIL
jgi:hypothetical protein